MKHLQLDMVILYFSVRCCAKNQKNFLANPVCTRCLVDCVTISPRFPYLSQLPTHKKMPLISELARALSGVSWAEGGILWKLRHSHLPVSWWKVLSPVWSLWAASKLGHKPLCWGLILSSFHFLG